MEAFKLCKHTSAEAVSGQHSGQISDVRNRRIGPSEELALHYDDRSCGRELTVVAPCRITDGTANSQNAEKDYTCCLQNHIKRILSGSL